MYSVTIVEYLSHKSTTYHFDKLKTAYEFLRSSRKAYPRAYFCLYFDRDV